MAQEAPSAADLASMRPRLKAAENDLLIGGHVISPQCFNEAAA